MVPNDTVPNVNKDELILNVVIVMFLKISIYSHLMKVRKIFQKVIDVLKHEIYER